MKESSLEFGTESDFVSNLFKSIISRYPEESPKAILFVFWLDSISVVDAELFVVIRCSIEQYILFICWLLLLKFLIFFINKIINYF